MRGDGGVAVQWSSLSGYNSQLSWRFLMMPQVVVAEEFLALTTTSKGGNFVLKDLQVQPAISHDLIACIGCNISSTPFPEISQALHTSYVVFEQRIQRSHHG